MTTDIKCTKCNGTGCINAKLDCQQCNGTGRESAPPFITNIDEIAEGAENKIGEKCFLSSVYGHEYFDGCLAVSIIASAICKAIEPYEEVLGQCKGPIVQGGEHSCPCCWRPMNGHRNSCDYARLKEDKS